MSEQKSRRFRDHISDAGKTASRAYEAVGGLRGAAQHAKNYARETFGETGSAEHHAQQAKTYMQSDEGRANARHAAGSAFHRFLQDKSKKAYKRGGTGYITGAVFQFAHQAFEAHMRKLGNEQKLYRDVARVGRGAPEIKHMTHEELRNVIEHAQSYGGPHNEKITQAAHGELLARAQRTAAVRLQVAKDHKAEMMRHTVEQRDKLRPEVKKLAEKEAADREKINEKAHRNRMARLRQVHSNVQANEKAIQATRTKGVKERQALHITKRTKSGGGYDDKHNFHTAQEIAASNKRASKSKAPGNLQVHGPTGTATKRKRAPRMR